MRNSKVHEAQCHMSIDNFFVPTFEENGNFMLGVVFLLFSQFSPIEIKVFDKNILYPIEDIDFLSSNLKRYFTFD